MVLARREALGCGLGGNTVGFKRHLQSLLRDKKNLVFYFPYSFMCFTYSYELNSKEAQSCADNKETAGGLRFR